MAAPTGDGLLPFSCRGCGVLLAEVDLRLVSFRVVPFVALYISRDESGASLTCPNRSCRTVNRLRAVSGAGVRVDCSPEQRAEIGRRHAAGENVVTIARELGVSHQQVSRIVRAIRARDARIES